MPPESLVAVLDTCGISTLVPGFPADGLQRSAERNLIIFASLTRVSAAGGAYRLCWCKDCRVAEDFRTDFGAVHVLGPSPLKQHRTCISGQTCQISDIAVHGYLDGFVGEVMILETCSLPSVIPRFPFDGVFVSLAAAHGSHLRSFRADVVTAAGGKYQMCWCGNAPSLCDEPSDFVVTFGMLTIVGPAPLNHQHTCVSGRVCELNGLPGELTSPDDSILISDTCGSDDAIVIVRPFLLASEQQFANDGSVGVWNSAALTAAGGLYRLCWCSQEASRCSQAADFATDMGELLLIGPSPLQQDKTCVSGQSCEFDGFLGTHISSRNRILVADTCGQSSAPSAMSIASVSAASGHSAVVSWAGPLKVSGGTYRLCWCSGEVGARPCYGSQDFRTDVGALTVVGVSPVRQDRTCVSGVPCTIDGLVGTYITGSDSYLVLDTCGFGSSVVPGFPGTGVALQASGALISWGAVRITAAGGNYALCWCPGSSLLEEMCSSPGRIRTVLLILFTMVGVFIVHKRV